MPHLCSSLSHQSFSSCREWRRCLKPVWNLSSAKHGERTPVGPWPLCCPQWSLHVRFLLAAVTTARCSGGGNCFYSGYSRTRGRLSCLCPVSARTCLKASGWVFAVPSRRVLQELGSAARGFRSHCKPRVRWIWALLWFTWLLESSSSVRECWTDNQRATTEPNSSPVFSN